MPQTSVCAMPRPNGPTLHSQSAAPIHQFPDELLVFIFTYCSINSRDASPKFKYRRKDSTNSYKLTRPTCTPEAIRMDPSNHSMHPLSCPALLLQVCGKWRSLAIAIPSLWVYFRITVAAGFGANPGLYVPFPLEAMEKQLERCGSDRGIEVHLELPRFESSRASVSRRRYTLDRLNKLLSALHGKNSHRWTGLYIKGSYRTYKEPPSTYFPSGIDIDGSNPTRESAAAGARPRKSHCGDWLLWEILRGMGLHNNEGTLPRLEVFSMPQALNTKALDNPAKLYLETCNVIMTNMGMIIGGGLPSLVDLNSVFLPDLHATRGAPAAPSNLWPRIVHRSLCEILSRIKTLTVHLCSPGQLLDTILPALSGNHALHGLSIGIIDGSITPHLLARNHRSVPSNGVTVFRDGVLAGQKQPFVLPDLRVLQIRTFTHSTAAFMDIISAPRLAMSLGVSQLVQSGAIEDHEAIDVMDRLAQRSSIQVWAVSTRPNGGKVLQCENWRQVVNLRADDSSDFWVWPWFSVISEKLNAE